MPSPALPWTRRLGISITVLLVFFGPVLAVASPKAAEAEYRTDRLIVRPAPARWMVSTESALLADASASVRFASSAELAATAATRAALNAKLGLRSHRAYSAFGGIEVLELSPGASPEETRAILAASGLYVYVERDQVHRINLVPSDPRYTDGTLWGMNNTGQSGGVADADIDAPEAWNIRTDASSVVVAVIDTGIRTTHQDLSGNLWTNPGESGGGKETNGVDDDGNGYIDDVHGINSITGSGNPADDNGHGSHCAGTIGGYGNDGVGVVGVAWRVKLMGLKFLSAAGPGSTSDAIECIAYARAKGAHILSNSWGGGGFSSALRDAIAACRADGIVFVAAAGNESANTDVSLHYPSNYELDNIVSVAATDRTDAFASFSNRGFGSVQLGAPGVAITSSVSSGDTAYSSYSGTSMATPHVAGALALMRAQFPSDTYAQLINRLLRAVDPIPALAGQTLTGGRLNAYRSLTGTLNTPPNDTFAGRLVLPATTSVYVRTFNHAATAESGEPLHAAVGASKSIWFSWTAPSSGSVTVSLAGSSFDTLLGVYTGSAVNALTELVGNDNAATGVTTSRVTFNAVAGTAYQIAVDGKAAATGGIVLRLTTPPANDAFASPSALNGIPATATGTNIGAGREANEPVHAGVTGGASVWWSWTAPSSGSVALSTAGSSFDTVLAIYTGSGLGALTLIGGNDDASGVTTSRVTFNAIAGVNYRIAVDGRQGATGSVRLSISGTPSNDDFVSRIVLPGGITSTTGSSVGASRESGEPSHGSSSSSASVWWSWTAPSSGLWQINTIGSDFDTLLGVYTGTAVNALNTLATNDDGGGNYTSLVTIQAVAGTVYQIAVDGWGGDTGAIRLGFRASTAAPSNDAFAARETITLSSNGLGAVTGSSSTATKEVGEPFHAGQPGGRSVWWRWTAQVTGNVVIDTNGSDFDTLLAVYSGSSVSALTEIASNDNADEFQSRVEFPVNAGSTYALAVDGAGGGGGSVVLSIAFTAGNQRPVVTAATLVPEGRGYADSPLTVTGVVASDAEGDPVTFSYQWQSSEDGFTWAEESGEIAAFLAPADIRAGRFWRCVVRASDANGTGPGFTTARTGLERRAGAGARHGQPYVYDPALPLALPPGAAYDRAFWINEFSQGPNSGGSEWFELLVLQPTDLRGYMLRDVSASAGITFSDHVSWASVPAGTVLVIYNGAATKDPVLPADDYFSGDRRLVMASSAPYFTGTWPVMSNSNPDGIVARDPSGSLVDGVAINGSVVHVPALGVVGLARSAHFTGSTTAGVDTPAAWNIVSSSALTLTPGAGNGATNTTFITNLRNGTIETPTLYGMAGGALPPGLALDPVTGIVSGTPNVPGGGFFTFTLRRTANAGPFVERTVQLLVGDADGVYRVPAGQVWTLEGDTVLTGALDIQGEVVTAGHALRIARTYAAWAALHAIVDLSDREGDFDGDGYTNLLEFALGADPSVADSGLIRAERVVIGGVSRLAVSFRRQIEPRYSSYAVEWSGDLLVWHPFTLETHLAVPVSAPDAQGYEELTVHAPSIVPTDRVFLRVVVTE